MPTAVDGLHLPLLVVDDNVIDLLKVANEEELRATAQGDRSLAAFSYPRSGFIARDWLERTKRLRAHRVIKEVAAASPLGGALWERELDRQDLYGKLSRQLADASWTEAAVTMKKLYGQPTESDFYEAVGEIRRTAAEVLDEPTSFQPAVQEAATELMVHLAPLNGLPVVLPRRLPSLSLLETLRDWYQPVMEPFWQRAQQLGLPDQCTANDIGYLFTYLLADTGLSVELTSEVTAISFEPSKRRVAIPLKRKMSLQKLLYTILPHEWVHISRYLNGLLLGVDLAAFGLPGYLSFEEGLATAVASVMGTHDLTKAVTSYARPEAMVAIGLAAGLAPGGPWSLWAVYNLFYWYYKLENLLSQKGELNLDHSHERGDHQAFTRVVRTFRGTPGPAIPDLGLEGEELYCPRDLSYRQGNVAFWEWAAANVDLFPLLLSAKANLADPQHLAFIRSCQ